MVNGIRAYITLLVNQSKFRIFCNMSVIFVTFFREDAGTESIFGQGSYMNPNDTRQYLYRLTPVDASDHKNIKV